jgi:RNA polymerase sigma-70 factor (ECF subfamily)
MRQRADWFRDSSVDQRSDAELMADVSIANGEALSRLFQRYGRLVYRVAADILRDAAEAEDIVQEVFLEVYCRAHLYDPARGSVRLWFLQYAYHRTLRRKASLRRRAAYGSEPLDAAESTASADRRRLTAEECRWVIRAGLKQLSSRQRAAVELACFKGFSLREVADRLGVSFGCARHYYYRGLARLRAWAREAELTDSVGGGLSANGRQPRAGALEQPVKLMAGETQLDGRACAAISIPFESRERLGDRGQRTAHYGQPGDAGSHGGRHASIEPSEVLRQVFGSQA